MTTIVIPVHNAPSAFDRCIRSVLSALRSQDRVIIIDDGSDSFTADLCSKMAKDNSERVELVRVDRAQGFTRSANVGMRLAFGDDVVLLNSDTVVAAGWLCGIERVSFFSPRIGIVGPLSNAASFQSIPEILEKDGAFKTNFVRNDVKSVAIVQAACKALGSDLPPQLIDIVNGFCIYIRSSVIEEIGFLDEIAFPRGYGEENDFCLRAGDCGFFCAVATDSFVYHEKTQSYTSAERVGLSAAANRILIDRYGTRRMTDAANGMAKNPVLVEMRKRMRNWFMTDGKAAELCAPFPL
jgi:GT2 family glycosyltransferase